MKDDRPSDYPMCCCFCDNRIETVRQRHNAEPIMDSWCCEECNTTKVIPYRMQVLGLNWYFSQPSEGNIRYADAFAKKSQEDKT